MKKFKVGDRLYCKFNTLNFTKGKMYYIVEIFNANDNDMVIAVTNDMGGRSHYTIKEILGYSLSKVFYTEQEIRKLKLERIENEGGR